MSDSSPLIDFPPALQCLFVPKRYKVLWGGRGAGRSWGAARALLIIGRKKKARILCVRELQKSIEDSVHRVLAEQVDLLGLSAFYEVQKAKIIGLNGTVFSFEGIKNNANAIKSYEGIDYCWVEEGINVTKNSWTILIPTIRKPGSEIWITFNPELETDHTYKRWVRDKKLVELPDDYFGDPIRTTKVFVSEKDDPRQGSFVVKMTWRDNPWFNGLALKHEMEYDRENDPDKYLWTWEGNCKQVLDGAIFAKELRKAQEQQRICTVPWDRGTPVSTYWDLGRADNTSIWFIQRVAMQWRVLEYFEATGEDIQFFIKELQRKEYSYASHWLPHDAKNKMLHHPLSIEAQVRKAFPGIVRVAPRVSDEDGINACRLIFNSCWFDEENCEDGINSLRHFQFRVVNGKYSSEYLHNWASDGAKAFQTFALASRLGRDDSSSVGVMDRLVKAASDKVSAFRNRPKNNAGGQQWMS